MNPYTITNLSRLCCLLDQGNIFTSFRYCDLFNDNKKSLSLAQYNSVPMPTLRRVVIRNPKEGKEGYSPVLLEYILSWGGM